MKWKDLSMSDKALLIKLGVLSGIRDIKLIKELYDSYENIPITTLSDNTNLLPLQDLNRVQLDYGLSEEQISAGDTLLKQIEDSITKEQLNAEQPSLFRRVILNIPSRPMPAMIDSSKVREDLSQRYDNIRKRVLSFKKYRAYGGYIDDPPFLQRILNNDNRSVVNWENNKQKATHKLSYAQTPEGYIVYPEVQVVNGKLHDFTDPKYKHDKWDALNNAIRNNDTLLFSNEQDALKYTQEYKLKYPEYFKQFDKGGYLSNTLIGHKVKKYAKGGFENPEEPPIGEILNYTPVAKSTNIVQSPLSLEELLFLKMLENLGRIPTLAELILDEKSRQANLYSDAVNTGVISEDKEDNIVNNFFRDYNNFRYSHPWAKGLNWTPFIGDAMDIISLAGDINNKNYINAGLGLGMLALPNFIQKPLLKYGKLLNKVVNIPNNHILNVDLKKYEVPKSTIHIKDVDKEIKTGAFRKFAKSNEDVKNPISENINNLNEEQLYIVNKLKELGYDLSKIDLSDLNKAFEQRRILLILTHPNERYTIINPDNGTYNIYAYNDNNIIGDAGAHNRADHKDYFKMSDIRKDLGSIEKGLTELIYNAAIEQAHKLGYKGLASGYDLRSPGATRRVWRKYNDKTLLGTYGNHYFYDPNIGIIRGFSNLPIYGLNNSTSLHYPTKSLLFDPSIIDNNGIMHVNWYDKNIEHKNGGYILPIGLFLHKFDNGGELNSQENQNEIPNRANLVGTVSWNPFNSFNRNYRGAPIYESDNFGDSFRLARIDEAPIFIWNGKAYNTDLKPNPLVEAARAWDTKGDLRKREFQKRIISDPEGTMDYFRKKFTREDDYTTFNDNWDKDIYIIDEMYKNGALGMPNNVIVKGANYDRGNLLWDYLNTTDLTYNQKLALMANSYKESRGWTTNKQTNGPAKGYYQMESVLFEKYQDWLNKNKLEDNIINETKYIIDLFENHRDKLITPISANLDIEDIINNYKDAEEAHAHNHRSTYMHRGYYTEDALRDWDEGDLDAAVKAMEALFEKAGKPRLEDRQKIAWLLSEKYK